MINVGTVSFTDADSNDEAFAFIRASPGLVALSLSLKSDGDIDVAFDPQVCLKLISELQRALAISESLPPPP